MAFLPQHVPTVRVLSRSAWAKHVETKCALLMSPRLAVLPLRVEVGAACRPERGSYARAPPAASPTRKRPKTLEERFLDEWRPPRVFPNRYVAVAAALLALGLAWYSASL